MGKINTLNQDDDDHHPSHDQGDGSDSDEGRQGFFVGGSEHSGQQVLGPSDADRNRRAQNLFDAVRRAGAEEMSTEESERIRNSRSDAGPYQGGAYRLGDTGDPVVHPTSRQQPTASTGSGPIVVRVLVWQNGFSIGDGPLRAFEDPTSRAFLTSLQQGVIPPEIQAQHPGREIDMHMERKATDYVPPKAKPFSSEGCRLGGIVPEVVTIDDDEGQTVTPDGQEAANLLKRAQSEVKIDESQPRGQICIRQPDGQRLIGDFNESHTVEDVRSFIVAALPHFSYQPFQLYTTYPKRAIEDEKQTVKAAEIFKGTVAIVKT